jgi:hypothetical protein
MYTIHLAGHRPIITTAPTAAAALAETDRLADQLHEQLHRNGEGNNGFWAVFVATDTTTGQVAAWTATNGGPPTPRHNHTPEAAPHAS